jgi:uncharacterized protein
MQRNKPMSQFKFIEWKNQGKFLRGSLHISRKKGGAWVVFSHGFTANRMGPGYVFVRIARELAAAGISSLRFDFGGSGESDGLFSDMSVAAMKSDLGSAIALVEKRFAPSRLGLLGHSLGGCVAALMCAHASGLILLAPVADPMGMARRRKEVIARGPNQNGFFENGPHEMGPGFLQGLAGIDPAEEMAKHFKGALFLIQGTADASISVAESRTYADAARNAGLKVDYSVFEGSDHNFSTVSAHKQLCGKITAWAVEHLR